MMKFRLALAFLLPLATPALAQNPGVALRWDACFGEGAGVQIKTFACDTNAGSERLVGSFISHRDVPEVISLEIWVDLSTYLRPSAGGGPGGSGPPIPAWWTFKNATSCRRSALQAVFTPDPANQVCEDWISGQVVGAIATYTLDFDGPGTARLFMGAAAGAGATGAVAAETEYSAFTLIISHANTVESAACPGCALAMVVEVRALKIGTPQVVGQPSGDIFLFGPLNGFDSNIAFWQGRPGTVPTRTTSWGAVKALYH